MTITAISRGQSGNGVSSSTASMLSGSTFTPGSLAVLIFIYDNSAPGGGDPFVSISDAVGNDWISRSVIPEAIVNPGSGVNGGCCMRVFTTVVNRLTSSDIVTVTFNTPTAFKAWIFQELSSDIGCIEFNKMDGTTQATFVNPAFLSSSVNVGEMLVGAYCQRSNSAITGDSDTLNGSWSTLIQRASNISIASQRKLQSGVASSQTWNLTISAPLLWTMTFARFVETPGSFGWPKVWNGSAWVRKPMKVWNGTAWVIKPVKRWTGTAWVID